MSCSLFLPPDGDERWLMRVVTNSNKQSEGEPLFSGGGEWSQGFLESHCKGWECVSFHLQSQYLPLESQGGNYPAAWNIPLPHSYSRLRGPGGNMVPMRL